MPAGRPTKYSEKQLYHARNLSLLGYTDEQIAEGLKVTNSTYYKWRKDYPEFSEAVDEGKAIADAEVAASLFDRARNGDVGAAKMWLCNRQPGLWREKKEVSLEVKSLEDILEESQQEDNDAAD